MTGAEWLRQEGFKEAFMEGYREGYREGFRIGTEEMKREIALRMLKKRMDIKLIEEVTGLKAELITTISDKEKP